MGFLVLVLIFYDFPTVLPVSGSSMSKSISIGVGDGTSNKADVDRIDYASAVIAVMGLFAALNWFMHARKHYSGPRLETDIEQPEGLSTTNWFFS